MTVSTFRFINARGTATGGGPTYTLTDIPTGDEPYGIAVVAWRKTPVSAGAAPAPISSVVFDGDINAEHLFTHRMNASGGTTSPFSAGLSFYKVALPETGPVTAVVTFAEDMHRRGFAFFTVPGDFSLVDSAGGQETYGPGATSPLVVDPIGPLDAEDDDFAIVAAWCASTGSDGSDNWTIASSPAFDPALAEDDEENVSPVVLAVASSDDLAAATNVNVTATFTTDGANNIFDPMAIAGIFRAVVGGGFQAAWAIEGTEVI